MGMRKKIKKSNFKGQASLEYIGLIGIVVLALFALSMQDYFKRAIMGKLRQDVSGTFGTEQYHGSNTDIMLYKELDETYTVAGDMR